MSANVETCFLFKQPAWHGPSFIDGNKILIKAQEAIEKVAA